MIYGINNKKTLKTAAVLVLCAFIMTILPVLPAEAAVVTRINTSAVNLTDKSDYAVVTLDSLADQADMTISMVGDYLTCFKVEIAGSAITPQNSTIDAADTSTEISMGKDTVATLKISLNHAAITDILLPPPILGKVRITDSMGKNYEVTVTYNGSSIGQVYTSTNVVNLKQDVMEGDGDDTFYVWLDSTAEDGENVVIALDTERDGTTGMYRDNFYALLLNTDKNIQNSEIIIQQDSGETESYNNIVYPKVANGKSIVVKMTHNEPLKIRLCKKNTEADNSNLTAGAKLGKITFTVVGSNRGSGADVYYEQQDVTLNRISFRESTLAMAKGTNYFFHPVFEPTGTNIWDLVWASDDDTIVSFSGDSLGRKNNQIGLLTAHEVTAPEHPVKVRVYSRANPTDIQDELFVYVYEAFEPTTDYLIMHTNDQPHFALDEAALNQGTPNVYGDQQTTADGTEKITVKGFTDPFHLGLYDANKYQDIANGQITDASKNDF
ncbi:MAG: hypothetical protein IKM15_03895, partial [Peptococcaceae bacterium]|nr:hypothetical protein [Peptococcaceae bacterium]